MFKGEKSLLFWAGLVIVVFASTTLLFNPLWNLALDISEFYWFNELKSQIPYLVSGIAFVLLGIYMMKSGVKKKEQ